MFTQTEYYQQDNQVFSKPCESLKSVIKLKRRQAFIKNLFLKCALTNKLDGGEDDQIKIRGIESFKAPTW